ncbi:MAG: hypothetical protein ABSG03_32870 [Bryobacteraceae bacterium]|jgi:hypothetical protein
MIAAVKGWYAVLSALLLLASGAGAADDLNSAAAILARKTAAFAGRGETVAVSYRNISSLGAAELAQTRTAFEAALRDAGCRPVDSAAVTEARVSISENAAQYLMVEEARKGEDRQVWIASWARAPAALAKSGGVALDRKQVWQQAEPILDIAFPPAGMLVLSPGGMSLYARTNDRWELRQSVPLTPAKPWPRDLRGRIHATGAAFQTFLPGMTCSGNTEPALSMECRAADAPWVLESGSRGLLLANFAASRNYFDGRIVTQAGVRKTVAPFYSAASVEAQGRTLWLLAQMDGQTLIADAAFDPLGSIGSWGSDIVGIDARCGAASQVLATRAGDAGEPDAIQSYAIASGAATPVTAPTLFPGPVTALWPSGAGAALAVARDLANGEYVAYVVTISCGS